MQYVKEKRRDIKVRAQADVLVAGGGLAGVSAAIAAAKAGAKVILVERNSFPGGVGTAGLCCSIANGYYTGNRKLVVKGNPYDIANRLAEQSGPGLSWHNHKGHVIFDVEKAKLVLSELLEEQKIEYLLETQVTDTIMEGNTLRGIFVESKSGREALLADAIVDATGDADLAVRSGAPYFQAKEGQGEASLCFRIANVDVDAFVDYFVRHPSEYTDKLDVNWTLEDALAQYHENGTFLFPHGGGYRLQVVQKGLESGEYARQFGGHTQTDALQMHAIRSLGVVHLVTGFVNLSALDIGQISREITNGRRMAFAVTEYFKIHMPGFSHAYVSQVASNMGIRQSRWIDAEAYYTQQQRYSPYRCSDAIGREVVSRKNGTDMFAAPIFQEEYSQIPYGCMVPKKIDGLVIGSGRSINTEGAFMRGMLSTMLIGQAAGVAAAVSIQANTTLRGAPMDLVQTELRRQGVDI